jgi:hypothetical protein
MPILIQFRTSLNKTYYFDYQFNKFPYSFLLNLDTKN